MENQNNPSFPDQNSPPHPPTNPEGAGENVESKKQQTSQPIQQDQQAPVHPEPQSDQQQTSNVQNPNQPQQEKVLKQENKVGQAKKSSGNPFLKKVIKIFVVTLVLLGLVAGGLFVYSRISGEGGVGGLLGEKGKVVWWGFREDAAVYNTLIEEYESQNQGVEVVYEKQSPNDYRERLMNALASGNGPDIFEIHSTWIPMFDTYLAPLPGQVMSQEEYNQIFYPVIVEDMTQEGQVLGVPLYYDALTLFINEDIFSSAAKQAPETWNDFRPLVSELTQRGEDGLIAQSGSPVGFVENVNYWPEVIGLMFYQNKVDFTNLTDDRAASVIKYFRSFATTEKAWDTRLPNSVDYFAQGKIAMHFAPSEAAQEIIQKNPNLRFITVNLPQLPKDSPDVPGVSYATYWTQGVWQKSSDKERAWDFLKFLTTNNSLIKMNEVREKNGMLEKPYPRSDMASLQHTNPIIGSVVRLAPQAKSWFLADETNDGPGGINSQLNEVFSSTIEGGGSTGAMRNLQSEVDRILSQYGVTQSP